MTIKTRRLLCILSLLAMIAGGGLLWLGGHSALATSIEELEAQAQASDNPLQAYRDLYEQLRGDLSRIQDDIAKQEGIVAGLENDLAELDARLVVAGQLVAAAQNAVEQTKSEIAVIDEEIAATEERIAQRQALLEDRLVNYYIYGDINLLDVAFESASFSDFATMADLTELIMLQDKQLVTNLTRERKILEDQRARLAKRMDELVALQHEYEDQVTSINLLTQEKAMLLNEAEMTQAQYEAYENSLEAAAAAAGDTIRELAKNANSSLSYGGVMYWPLPVEGFITSPYGYRTHPKYGDYRFHSGVDVGADGGTSIFSAADGEVIYRDWFGGYGNTVMVDHGDGIVTLYAHMSAYGNYQVGDFVLGGSDVIGYVGTTGTSTGNHLHFEVRVNGNTTDPMGYVRP